MSSAQVSVCLIHLHGWNMGDGVHGLHQYEIDENPQKRKHVVPKFASFKAKAQYNRQAKADSQNNKSVLDDGPYPEARLFESSEGGGKRRNDHASTGHRPRQDRHGHRAHGDGKQSVALSPTPGQDRSLETSGNDLFLSDRKGDSRNLEFGSLHRSAISIYRRTGAGTVIGSQDGRIDRWSTNDRTVSISNKRDELLHKRDKNALSKAPSASSKKLRVRLQRPDTSLEDRNADFLPLGSSQGKKRKRDRHGHRSDSSSSSDDSSGQYRTISLESERAKPQYEDDLLNVTATSESDNERKESALDLEIQRKRSELFRAVDVNPANCQAWLQLIDHQDKIAGHGSQSAQSRITTAEKQSNADVKLAMYEKALLKLTKFKDKERLILGMMNEGSKVWDAKRLNLKWNDRIRTFPQSQALWQKFL